MKNKNLFIVMLLLSILFCSCTYHYYRYQSAPIKIKDNIYKLVDVEAELLDDTKEGSPIKIISLHYWNYYRQYPQILSSHIKIKEKSGKIHILAVDSKYRNIVKVYEQGVTITNDCLLEVGDIKLSNGKIVTLPPILLKRYVEAEKVNKLLDTINIDTKERLFDGTVEDYKKGK